jgi:hypothetical protein
MCWLNVSLGCGAWIKRFTKRLSGLIGCHMLGNNGFTCETHAKLGKMSSTLDDTYLDQFRRLLRGWRQWLKMWLQSIARC